MPNYEAVKGTSVHDDGTPKEAWFIVFADGPQVGTRYSLTPYKTEKSAKERIRKLKAKELDVPVEITAIVPSPAPIASPVTFTGVYPGVSKRAYRRHWR